METTTEIRGPKGIQKYIGPFLYTLNPLKSLAYTQTKYGDFLRLSDIVREAYFTSDPEIIEEVLVKKQANFHKDFFLKTSFPLLGKGLLTSDGEDWRFQRALTSPAFLGQRLKNYAPMMIERTQKALETWKSSPLNRDIHRDMMTLTLEIVADALFGSQVDDKIDLIQHSLDIATKYFSFVQSYSSWLPIARQIPTPLYFRNKKAERKLGQVIDDLIRLKRETPGSDLLSQLIKAREDGNSRSMTNEVLKDNVFTLFAAGHETTALSLSYTWHLLSKNPKTLETLRDEISKVLATRTIQFDDFKNLVYLEAVIKESMRLFPPAWIMGRQAVNEVTLKTYTIPAGSQIYFSQWLVHRDARWFPEPNEFNPQRWLDGSEKQRPKFSYFPFGGGPRICVGSQFAMAEAMIIISTVLQSGVVKMKTEKDPSLIPSVTLRPAKPMWYDFTPTLGQ